MFDKPHNLEHLLSAQTGSTQPAWPEIYVKANSATLADATATALFTAHPMHAGNDGPMLKD